MIGNDRGWYVHVNVCGGIWACVTSQSLSLPDAKKLADDLRERGNKLVAVTTDWEKRGL